LHVKKDYTRAGIPMLPVVSSEQKSVRVIAGTTLMMVVFSILPFFFNQFGLIYLITATVFGAAMVALSIWLLVKPSEKASWTVFKFSSPYLTALFIAFIIDAIFHH
jgi:protoheme IX farnesyltransferase